MVFVSIHFSSPYSKTRSTVDLKNWILSSLFSFDFHILSRLFKAFQANPILTSMYLLLSAIHKPKYLKSSNCYSSSPPSNFIFESVCLTIIYSVFLQFICTPMSSCAIPKLGLFHIVLKEAKIISKICVRDEYVRFPRTLSFL